ncbi:MAG: response regulator transcription factor [Peptoniphilaceae bacterium]
MKYNILIVEDDKALCNGISLALKSDKYNFFTAHNISDAKKLLNNGGFDLVILDINLPDGSGLDLLTEIKNIKNIPVILLTANDIEIDIVTGLEMGADDYITKPFSLMVLRARVNTQLRKSRVKPDLIQVDSFIFDFNTMEFRKSGNLIELSKTEQKLLHLLIDNKGKTVARENLINKIWPEASDYVDENALSVAIKRLRDKLEEIPSKPQYIKTIYGIGYSWVVK